MAVEAHPLSTTRRTTAAYSRLAIPLLVCATAGIALGGLLAMGAPLPAAAAASGVLGILLCLYPLVVDRFALHTHRRDS